MSPAMQQALEQKHARRTRLMLLSYPEKVRIVEQMRQAAIEIKAAAGKDTDPGALQTLAAFFGKK